MNEQFNIIHPKSNREILFNSYRLYKNNLLEFLWIVLLLKGPYLICSYIIVRLIEIIFSTESLEQNIASNISYFASFLLRLLEFITIGPVIVAAITIVISELSLNNKIGAKESYKRLLKRSMPLLGTIVLTGLIISFILITSVIIGLSAGPSGSIIMIVGGIMACVLWTWYTFIPQTVTLEAEGGISAMKRSKYLVKGNFLRVLILFIIVLIAISIIMELIAFIIMKSFFFLNDYARTLAEGASNIISIILEPFRIIVIILLYYDLRIRKEGFDLEIMAEEIKSIER